MRWIPERRFRLVPMVGLLLASVGLFYLRSDDIADAWQQWGSRPILWTNAAEFHATIKNADRIVVREGGFDCCRSARELDTLKVIADVRDRHEIRDVYEHVVFDTSQDQLDACMCCGDLGIDWYRRGRRIALTAFHERGALRWKHFRCGYRFPGWSMAADAPLTGESTEWVKRWLVRHGADANVVKYRPAAGPAVPSEVPASDGQ